MSPSILVEPERAAVPAKWPGRDRPRSGPVLVESAGLAAARMELLADCPVFAGLPRDDLARYADACAEFRFAPGERIIVEGDRDSRLHVLISGRLSVYRTDEDGREVAIGEVGPGEPVGEMAYFSDGVRSASVRALAASRLLRAGPGDLAALMENAPGLERALLAVMARRLRATGDACLRLERGRAGAERALERHAVLLDVASSFGETLELATWMDGVVAKTTRILACERASFFVLDEVRDELWSVRAHGAEVPEIRIPVSSGLAGECAMNGETINCAEAYVDARFNPRIDELTGFRTRSVLCVPVRNRDGRVVGVTQAINKLDGVFSEDDADLLRAVASQLGLAVENAELHADTVNMMGYLNRVQESISDGIVTLDDGFRIVTANRAARTLLETPDPAAGATADLRRLLGPANGALFRMLETAYARREPLPPREIRLVPPGGDVLTVNVEVHPLVDAQVGFQGLVLVLDDRTREKRIEGTLARYVSSEIADRVLADPAPLALGGVRSTVTMLFSDIRGFTGIAETLSAEETMALLNEYFTLMVGEVGKHRGILDKFVGDALMAVFGVPRAEPGDAVRAVACALGMREALESFNRLRERSGHPPIRIGIGINTDEVLCGNLGSAKQMDYTVIGDGVNVSSRLEALNKEYGTSLLVSEKTRRQLGDAFVVRHVDDVRLSGKSVPLSVYEVLGRGGVVLTEHQAHFERGLAAYRRRDFRGALNWFRTGAPMDPVSRTFASRCIKLMLTPPAADWDGVWNVAGK